MHAQNKLVHEHQFTCAALSAQVITLHYVELQLQSKIFKYKMQSFLLLKNLFILCLGELLGGVEFMQEN